MPKPDMTLAVNVNVTGSIDNTGKLTANATYSQGATNPPSTGVVDAGGNIDLTKMNDQGNEFNNQTDITFMLSGSITSGNDTFDVNFPEQIGQAITIEKKSGGPPAAGEFAPALQSDTSLLLDDANSDGQDYTYCLTVEPSGAWADGTPTCPLDPNIVNR